MLLKYAETKIGRAQMGSPRLGYRCQERARRVNKGEANNGNGGVSAAKTRARERK